MDGFKILVVDDDPDIRLITTLFLKKAGYEVLQAETGQAGVELARQVIPSLIICDISMPEMDGFGVFEALKVIPETGNIPFIFLTAFSDSKNMQDSRKAGVTAFLTKPISKDNLIKAVQQYCPSTRASTQKPDISAS